MTDDPKELATLIASMPKPLLIATDVDGTLADLTEDPSESRLVPGTLEALAALHERGCNVAVVSGRPMCDLVVQFRFPASLVLIGSHGAEHGADPDGSIRTPAETQTLALVTEVLERVVAEHEGAWVEAKPFAAAIHVRRCAADVGERALLAARTALADLPAVRLLDGHAVLEVAVRNTSKRIAMGELRERMAPGTTVFIGDDASDEGVFESLTATDLGVKVGPGVTLAAHRLAAPQDTVELLTALHTML